MKSGMRTISPPFRADWWAQMPTLVQLADCSTFGNGSRSSTRALMNSLTRCGMRTAVAAALDERQMVLRRRRRTRELAGSRLRQEMGVVGHVDRARRSPAPDFLAVCSTGSSPVISCHSNDFFEP